MLHWKIVMQARMVKGTSQETFPETLLTMLMGSACSLSNFMKTPPKETWTDAIFFFIKLFVATQPIVANSCDIGESRRVLVLCFKDSQAS